MSSRSILDDVDDEFTHQESVAKEVDSAHDNTDDEGGDDGKRSEDRNVGPALVGGSGAPDDRLPTVSSNINADIDDGGEEINLQEAKDAVSMVKRMIAKSGVEFPSGIVDKLDNLDGEENDGISVLSPPLRPKLANRRNTDVSSAYPYNQDHTPSEVDYADSVHQGIRIKKTSALSAKNSQQISSLLETVSRLETRLANSEAENRSVTDVMKLQQKTLSDVVSLLDQTRSSLEKLDVKLTTISKDHTKAYEGLASDYSRLERISKNAITALEAAHEVDEVSPEVPAHVIATRQVMKTDIETPSQVDVTVLAEKPAKPSLPSWLAASMSKK